MEYRSNTEATTKEVTRKDGETVIRGVNDWKGLALALAGKQLAVVEVRERQCVKEGVAMTAITYRVTADGVDLQEIPAVKSMAVFRFRYMKSEAAEKVIKRITDIQKKDAATSTAIESAVEKARKEEQVKMAALTAELEKLRAELTAKGQAVA